MLRRTLLATALGKGALWRANLLLATGLVLGPWGCARGPEGSGGDHGHGHADQEQEPWAVTAWGDLFEVFPECDPLVAGATATSHTHVTVLNGFTPQREGAVSIVLRGDGGVEETFRQTQILRDGIFNVDITPKRAGTYDLAFVIETGGQREEIAGGKVRVGEHDEPGGLVEGPPARPGQEPASAAPSGDPVSFLKEQQWRTPFATDWVRRGSVRRSVQGQARIRPAAGGEVLLTAPLDGFVSSRTRLYPGLQLAAGAVAVRLAPRVGSGRSIAEIESELQLARSRLERLEQLLALEAVSRTEVEAARARVQALEPLSAAARGGSPSGAPAAGSDQSGTDVTVTAPFAALVAEVHVIPGQAVQAGDPLVRLVRANPVWVEVALRADAAAALRGTPSGLHLRQPGEPTPLSFDRSQVQLVSRAPEVDPATGTVAVILELRDAAAAASSPGGADALGTSRRGEVSRLQLGATVEAEVVLDQAQEGVVIPAEALVDDGGVAIVYVQTEGESFVRVPVQILAREGPTVLVDGLSPAMRLVTRGGAAIRRAALVSSGPIEGHVH